MIEVVDCLVIGAGPAGLMAAERVSDAGHKVVIADAMPSPARKFLMAGKSGLNLTHNAEAGSVARQITWDGDRDMTAFTLEIIQSFSPLEIRLWAKSLGITLFTGSTGRVFPVEMKASPLLRAWLARLSAQHVELRRRWRWIDLENGVFVFETPDGAVRIRPRKTILALGGASWPRLGSSGDWAEILMRNQILVNPFKPANMGFTVQWSPSMHKHFGAPVKGVAITADAVTSRGEWIISAKGVEGGGIYQIAAAIRDGGSARLDLAPDLDVTSLAERLAKQPPKNSLVRKLRNVLRDPLRVALALEWAARPAETQAFAQALKSVPMHLGQPFGLERAISSAGGVSAKELGADLALRQFPDIHLAGEMLDWEAPTGGYLLSMCLALGHHAGLGVVKSLQESNSSR